MNILFCEVSPSMADRVLLRKLRRSCHDDDDDDEVVKEDDVDPDPSTSSSSSPRFRGTVTAFNTHCIADAAAVESPKNGTKKQWRGH
jgi:hypothetical protein